MKVLTTILHITASLTLIMVVLLQAGKGTNMGAAFGGASQTVFGSSGAGSFLGKMTTVVAVVFILTSLTLSYFSLHRRPTLLDSRPLPAAERTVPAPAAPAAPK
ncbi:MAG: preprotein translocase subunit SecG [Smithellaceae bacterium]|nr:preprotein translocase subunit SecG [Smithellaceae bacterium]